MDSISTLALYGLGLAATSAGLAQAKSRLDLSRAKHRSLTGHVRWSKRIASLVPFYEFCDAEYFSADGAPADVATSRRHGFEALAADYRRRYAKTISLKAEAKPIISDMQFTDAYRVPFPFSRLAREQLGASPFVVASAGVTLTDVDGNSYYDLAGSYGVNVFGYDFYKSCMRDGTSMVADLGPVLGTYHPIVVDNVRRIRAVSGLDEVSFHMSGTEAVMQAVRLARFHTGRRRIVRFSGAYHGWWDDVQPGIGNPMRARDTLTLAEMSEATLKVLKRRRDIACVLVNPVQALHPNAAPAADSSLVDSSRNAHFDRAGYSAWLQQLRKVCSARGIVLILDEIFVGFRLARGGAQEYFGVKADMVTYGKTLGGGYPVGVLCGRSDLMRRYRPDRPADVCLARGTFNSHPYVMAAMNVFLQHIDSEACHAVYRGLDATWQARADGLNARFAAHDIPLKVETMSTIWTLTYTTPSRYNWMLQFYLRKHGVALSWIGTGRFIFSLNYTEQNFAGVADQFIAAANDMKREGWWWTGSKAPQYKKAMLREMVIRGLLKRSA